MKFISAIVLSAILLLSFSPPIKAQSMHELFLALPDYCTPGLNLEDRKTLINDTEFTVSGQIEDDDIDYTIDTVSKNYLAYEFSNGKGAGINESYEIKKFKFKNGKYLLIFAKTGNPQIHSGKYILKAFDVAGKSLEENLKNPIPEDLDYKVFLKFDTPDSIRAQFEKLCYYTFDLDPGSKDRIDFHIIMESDRYAKWLTGNTMLFQWNGNMFTNTIIFQKEESAADDSIEPEPYKR